MVTRRRFLQSSAALPALLQSQAHGAAGGSAGRPSRIVVVGAGAMGGWTALHLRQMGATVTLIDAWGPGNSRASSGGETRVIRQIYGGSRRHTAWTAECFAAWRELEQHAGRPLMRLTGVLWLFAGSDDYARASFPHLAAAGAKVLELSPADAAARYPQMSLAGIRTVVLEETAGVLMARQACAAVVERFQSLGGTYQQADLAPLAASGGPLKLADGSELRADQYVLACGPWLGRLLPDVVGDRVRATRQEVFFFGTPAGDPRFDEGVLPTWIEMNGAIVYGIPGNQGRGFKIADDTRGAPFDPTSGDRTPSAEGLARARQILARRFPALAAAPLLEARVCQYENTPDGDFILDRHPGRADVWILGGGSGHAFKMGPSIGLHAARAVLGQAPPEPALSLGRFRPPENSGG